VEGRQFARKDCAGSGGQSDNGMRREVAKNQREEETDEEGKR
jgi:hypothetical protein